MKRGLADKRGRLKVSTFLTGVSLPRALPFAGIPLLALLIQLGLTAHQRGVDDAFITYRYAKHLAEGHGMVWNIGDPPIYGTSTFLYTLLLALCYRLLGIDPPLASMVIGWFCWSCLPLLLYRLARLLTLEARSALWVALLATLNGLFVVWSAGMETPLYTLLLYFAFERYFSGSVGWAGILAGLASLTRLDGLLIPFVLSLDLLGRLVWKREPIWDKLARFGLGFLIVVLPAALALWHLVGDLVPHSFYAKRAHEFGISGRYHWRGIVKLGLFWYPFLGLLALLALPKVLHSPRWRLLIGWGLAYQLAYLVSNLPNFYWYYLPPIPVLFLVAAYGFEWLLHRRQALKAAGWMLASLSLGWIAARDLQLFRSDPLGSSFYHSLHRKAGLWLARYSEPQAVVMAYEVGMIGYYSNRRVIDMLGLTNPEMVQALRRRDYTWSVRHYKPDYLFITDKADYPLTAPVYLADWFRRCYREVYGDLLLPLADRRYILFRKVREDF